MRISVIPRKAISKSNSSAKRENIDLTFLLLLALPTAQTCSVDVGMRAFGNPVGRRGFSFTELVIRSAGGREGAQHWAWASPRVSGLCLSAPSRLARRACCGPGGIYGPSQHPQTCSCCCRPRCCGGHSEVSSVLAGPGRPACAALRTEELLCFSPDVGQPGTEIFNMPAITGAGNSRAVSVPYLTPCRAHRCEEQEAR